MTEQLKIICRILEDVDINAKEVVHKCIHQTAQLIKMNNLLEDVMNKPILMRYTSGTLAICCIVYITPLVGGIAIK